MPKNKPPVVSQPAPLPPDDRYEDFASARRVETATQKDRARRLKSALGDVLDEGHSITAASANRKVSYDLLRKAVAEARKKGGA